MVKASFVVLVLCVFAAYGGSPKSQDTQTLASNIVKVIDEVTKLVQDPSRSLTNVADALIKLLGLNVKAADLVKEIEDYVNNKKEGANIEHVKKSVNIISWIARGLISDCTINQALVEVISEINCGCQVDVNLIFIQIGQIPGIQVNKCLKNTSTFCQIIGIKQVEQIPEEGKLIIELVEVIIGQLKGGKIDLSAIIQVVVRLLKIKVDVSVVIKEANAYCETGTQGPNIKTVQSILSIIQIVIVGVVENAASTEVLQQIIVTLNIDIKITPLISQKVDEIYADAPNLSSCKAIPLLCVLINGGVSTDPTSNVTILDLIKAYNEVINGKSDITKLVDVILKLNNSEGVDPAALINDIVNNTGNNKDLQNLVLDVLRILIGISDTIFTVPEGLKRIVALFNGKDLPFSKDLSPIEDLLADTVGKISICATVKIPIICNLFYNPKEIKPTTIDIDYNNLIKLLLQHIKNSDGASAIRIALQILGVTENINQIVAETLQAIQTQQNNGPNKAIVKKVLQILVWGAQVLRGKISIATLTSNLSGLLGTVVNVVDDILGTVLGLVGGLLNGLGCIFNNSFICQIESLPSRLYV